MDIPTHAGLVEIIDRFLDRHDFAPTRLGREATGEPNLIPSIRAGRQPNLDTLNRLAQVMAEYDARLPAPPPAEWPLPQHVGVDPGDAVGDLAAEVVIADGAIVEVREAGTPARPFDATSSRTGPPDGGALPDSPRHSSSPASSSGRATQQGGAEIAA